MVVAGFIQASISFASYQFSIDKQCIYYIIGGVDGLANTGPHFAAECKHCTTFSSDCGSPTQNAQANIAYGWSIDPASDPVKVTG